MNRARAPQLRALPLVALMARALPLVALIAFGAAPASAQEIPPAPTRWVTDQAGFLSPATRDELDRTLEGFERRSGHQVIVWIGRSLAGASLEDWAARSFEAWGIGRRGRDDGAALFLFTDDRRVRIEVGYGLEDRLTDARAGRIIREVLAPRLQQGDRDGAVKDAVAAMLTTIDAQAARDQGVQPVVTPRELRPSWGQLLLFGMVGLFVLVLLVRHPGLALHLLVTLASSHGGHRRGGGFGGGGFSGGGGRSGGGGASGSW